MGSRKFRRKQKSKDQNPRLLIVSEGAVTELEYIEAVKKSRAIRSAQIEYVPPGPTSPVEIVQRALALRERDRRHDPFDAVWCMFDAEVKITQQARPGLSQAFTLARSHDVSVAFSNPCFELWILLHAEDKQAWIDSHAIQARCSNLGLVDDKHLCAVGTLLNNYGQARKRALALEAKHDREGRTLAADRNPSSLVFGLVDAIFETFPSR
jgi:RloB-like protein